MDVSGLRGLFVALWKLSGGSGTLNPKPRVSGFRASTLSFQFSSVVGLRI